MLPPSLIFPPRVKLLAAAVMATLLLLIVIAPAPRLRSLVPVKVKSPPNVLALVVDSEIAATVELLMVVPAPIVNMPDVPMAVALLIFKVPLESVIAPAPELVPVRVNVPALVLLTDALKTVLALMDNVNPDATSHVCEAPTVRGAAMNALLLPVSTRIPPDVLAGVRFSVPPVPGLTDTVVIPVGIAENCKLSIPKAPSRVVVMVLKAVGAPVALKMTVCKEVGMVVESAKPATSVVQFAAAAPNVAHD